MNAKLIRDNNFDNLRFLFASIVLLVHCRTLFPTHATDLIGALLNPSVPVHGFFVLSGFLIFKSYVGSKSILEYIERRIRRIYPAYFSVVSLSVFWGYLITDTPSSYLNLDLLKYFSSNIVFLNFIHPELPGVFQRNANHAIDGALWTIKIEILFYFIVPILSYLFEREKFRLVFIFILYTASVLFRRYFISKFHETGNHIYEEISRQLPGQISYFMTGTIVYYYFEKFSIHKMEIAFFSITLYLLAFFSHIDFLYPLSFGLLIMLSAFIAPLPSVGKYGDFSYGLYVWHFPIIQCLISMGVFSWSVAGGVASTIVLASAAAVMSWYLVERPWLLRSSRDAHSVPVADAVALAPFRRHGLPIKTTLPTNEAPATGADLNS